LTGATVNWVCGWFSAYMFIDGLYVGIV
jgi:hypothetical protein